MLYPVVQTRGIQMQRRNRKRSSSLSGAESKDDAGQPPCKKHRTSPLFSSTIQSQLSSATDHGSDVAKMISSCCDDKETVNGTTGLEEPKVTNTLYSCILFFFGLMPVKTQKAHALKPWYFRTGRRIQLLFKVRILRKRAER